jgi:hypothetical protein
MKPRRGGRSGAEICRELLEIPDDVHSKLLLQAFAEMAVALSSAIQAGELCLEDKLPAEDLERFTALELQFAGEDDDVRRCQRYSTRSVLGMIEARMIVIGGEPPTSARQRRFMKAVENWGDPEGDEALLNAAARLVTP